MPMRSGSIPTDRLREAINARLATTSLRGLARDVGMSPSGLQKFLDGAAPYFPTQQKLERWFVRETAACRVDRSLESWLAALMLLVGDLPPARRGPAALELLDRLEAAYRSSPSPPPPWLGELRRAVRENRLG